MLEVTEERNGPSGLRDDDDDVYKMDKKFTLQKQRPLKLFITSNIFIDCLEERIILHKVNLSDNIILQYFSTFPEISN